MKIERWISTTEAAPWQTLEPLKIRKTASGEVIPGKVNGPVWRGFGGCFNELGAIALKNLSAAKRRQIFQLLFDSGNGCGFVMNRMPVGASDYSASWYSCDEIDGDYELKHFSLKRDEKYLIPYILEAKKYAPSMKLFASPWSPPTWMKNPPVYNYGRIIRTPQNMRAYANYLLKYTLEMQKRGIPVTQIHVQNEVFANQKFPSCLWSGDELREFIRDYLGPVFRKAGMPAELWLGTINGSTFGDFNSCPNRVFLDPEARKYISGLAFQWAGRDAVPRCRSAWPDMRVIQSENECGNGQNTWEYSRYIFELLYTYLNAGVESYVYWNMVLENNCGISTWGWKQNTLISIDTEKGTYRLNPEYYLMRHFAQFIPPGSHRMECSGCWCANTVAFMRPDKKIAVVMMNPYGEEYTVNVAGNKVILPGFSFNTFILGVRYAVPRS